MYTYGPVPSRRFGRSFGVDLIPFKTCDLDCIFCQLGRTVQKTVCRQEYVPINAVILEIEAWLNTGGNADYITLSGSGEPTLHSGFGEVLKYLGKTPIPSLLLTNGSTLYIPEVREAAAYADVVKVSLSAWDQESFTRVNRPHDTLSFDHLVDGQKQFRAEFKGQLWMEIFLVEGFNSRPEDVRKIASCAKIIKPDRIQLNTVVRPPAEKFAQPCSMELLKSLQSFFDPFAEIISDFRSNRLKNFQADEEKILSILKRRPCTIEQLTKIYGMNINEVSKHLSSLLSSQRIRGRYISNKCFYSAIAEDAAPHVKV
jgi:wyosine [tRNA(Phe)-imidazoG37] synthetase (radical SAM superfamily)